MLSSGSRLSTGQWHPHEQVEIEEFDDDYGQGEGYGSNGDEEYCSQNYDRRNDPYESRQVSEASGCLDNRGQELNVNLMNGPNVAMSQSPGHSNSSATRMNPVAMPHSGMSPLSMTSPVLMTPAGNSSIDSILKAAAAAGMDTQRLRPMDEMDLYQHQQARLKGWHPAWQYPEVRQMRSEPRSLSKLNNGVEEAVTLDDERSEDGDDASESRHTYDASRNYDEILRQEMSRHQRGRHDGVARRDSRGPKQELHRHDNDTQIKNEWLHRKKPGTGFWTQSELSLLFKELLPKYGTQWTKMSRFDIAGSSWERIMNDGWKREPGQIKDKVRNLINRKELYVKLPIEGVRDRLEFVFRPSSENRSPQFRQTRKGEPYPTSPPNSNSDMISYNQTPTHLVQSPGSMTPTTIPGSMSPVSYGHGQSSHGPVPRSYNQYDLETESTRLVPSILGVKNIVQEHVNAQQASKRLNR